MYVCLLVNPTASKDLNVQMIDVANPGKFSFVTVPGMTSVHPTLCRFVSPTHTPLEDALSAPRQGATTTGKITFSLAATGDNIETIVVHSNTKRSPQSFRFQFRSTSKKKNLHENSDYCICSVVKNFYIECVFKWFRIKIIEENIRQHIY